MKLNFLKKEKIFKKERSSPNLYLYWSLAVGLMFAATIASLYLGYRLFLQVNKEFVLEAGSTSGQVETVKKDRILNVLKYFSERETKSAEILNAPAPVVDPSL